MRRHLARAVLLVVLSFGAADARPCGQVEPCPPIILQGPLPTVFPADDPAGLRHETAGGRPVAQLAQAYVEEEYFVSGTTGVFTWNAPVAMRGDAPGDALLLARAKVPYTTRLVVKRPTKRRRFSGTVVVEFMNSTAGFDSEPSWMISADYFAREGIVHIGVTTSASAAIPYLVGGCGGPAGCGSRYASLTMVDNGQEYEIVSQLVTALKGDDRSQRPLPERFRDVKRVFVTGQSQQAGSVITHANEFLFDLVDGYFVEGNTAARSIRGPVDTTLLPCGNPGAAPFPDCLARLGGTGALVRTDLPVPVYHGIAETDFVIFDGFGARQDDTDTSERASYRLIEIAGTSHTMVHAIELIPGSGFLLGDLCLNEPNSLADGPILGNHVWNAYWHHMRRQVERGIVPPRAPRFEADTEGNLLRDELQNARGGVRLPELDHPTRSYFSPLNSGKDRCAPGQEPPACVPDAVFDVLGPVGGLACTLLGSSVRLSADELDARYGSHRAYVRAIKRATRALVKAGFLLKRDGKLHRRGAARSDVGRGGTR